MKDKSYRLSLIAILALLPVLSPATTRWTGGAGTTDWTNGANWDGGVPDGTENVYVSANGVNGTAVLSTTDSGATFGVGWYTGGTSTLTIASSGDFSNTGTSTLGRYADALGTINVNGGQFTSGNTSGDDLIIGYAGTGALNISNGGTVSAGDFYMGYTTDGAGSLTVTGSGSTLTTAGSAFVVGRSGGAPGTLSITAGGKISSAGTAYLGNTSTTVGDATVTGADSLWDAATLLVGNSGQGTLTISDGGLVSAEFLSIDVTTNGPIGEIRIGIDGMLAVGDGDTTATTLGDFVALIDGSTDNIKYWDGAAWDDIANGTLGTDYTLTEYDEGSTSFTKLTVIPEPATLGLICLLAGGMIFVRRRFLV